ncbi:MAG TPA: class I SAM-dependent methyltransferase [Bryobacteraceae bacterium]|nr:class I SAM-dependent methyltransferase [Bryobacteraceae bacterium]
MTRRGFLQLIAAAAAHAQAPARTATEREEIIIPDFASSGYILDLGGGCRGTIGRLKGEQVVAIDISMKELNEAPSGFLKILMDASDLKFPDKSFRTVTDFFALMFMKSEIHQKVFAEAYRVLAPGGEWLIWDASIPARAAGEDHSFLINLHTRLPKETIDYGYSVQRLDFNRDPAYYRALAEQAGFQIATVEILGRNQKAFFMRLHKPE